MKIFAEGVLLYSYIAILYHMLLAKFVTVHADWLVDCGDCRCKWNSGKKTADCKNLSLSSVPDNLSSELQVLDLSHNHITYLEEDAFLAAQLQNLHKLFIRNCSLENLDPKSLRSLAILIELDLSYNLLRTLQVNIFANLVKVRSLILNNNLLESLDDGIFQDLKYLHKVELKDNRISRISNGVFVNVPLLSQIYLSGNRLGFLRKEPFESLKRLTSLSLELNPWNCTCELQVFRDFVLKRNLYTPPTSCYYPSHLRGMLWIEDQPEAFACKPKIIYPSRGASINTSKENVTLICRVHASPNTLIAWDYNKQMYNNGQHPQPRIHIQLLREEQSQEKEFGRDIFISRLTILGAEKSDEGTYTCIAENAGGKDVVQMSLLVQKQTQKDLLLQSNLIIVICLMALGLLSVSVFLSMVTCCIYKRFKAINQRHHHHHHLGTGMGSIGDGSTIGVITGDIGTDNGTSQTQHQLHQKTNLNGFNLKGGGDSCGYGSGYGKDKYSEAIKQTSLENGGAGHILQGRFNNRLQDTLNETQLGQSERTYLEKNIDDALNNSQQTMFSHGQSPQEINLIKATKRHHQIGEAIHTVADYQPDLLPTIQQKTLSYNNNSDDSISARSTAGDSGHHCSPTTTAINQQNKKESLSDSRQMVDHQYSQQVRPKWQHSSHEQQQQSYQKHLQEDFRDGTTGSINIVQRSASTYNSKYNNINLSTADYLQSSFLPATTSEASTTELHGDMSKGVVQLTKLSKYEINSGLIAKQQEHTKYRPPIENISSYYEYRQPPPPPYQSKSTGMLMSNLKRTSSVNNGNNNDENDCIDSSSYINEAIADATTITRQTIVTTSPSLNFLTGYTPRRQLL